MIAEATHQDTPSIVQNEIALVPGELPRKYSELSGREKRDYLFDRGIRATAYGRPNTGPRPDVVTGLLQFSKSAFESVAQRLLSETVTRVGDELEVPKVKLFHTYGATANILFTPEPRTPYTGLLSEQVAGLARFSYAGPVVGVGVVPGLALKFLVDGDHPSENLVAMRKLDRQQPLWRYLSTRSHNSVFQNPFTNILPPPAFTNFVMRAVGRRFETVVERGKGLHQPADNLARIRSNGEPVPEQSVKAPYRLIFRPTREAASATDPTIDFRDDLARNIKSGMTFYEVFALDDAEERELIERDVTRVEAMISNARKIGTIKTESEFVASKYGDYRLFFKHNARFLRPEFKR